jgi:hypothetical protein
MGKVKNKSRRERERREPPYPLLSEPSSGDQEERVIKHQTSVSYV